MSNFIQRIFENVLANWITCGVALMVATIVTFWAKIQGWPWTIPILIGLSMGLFVFAVMFTVRKNIYLSSNEEATEYEEITVSTEKATGLNIDKLKLMELSPAYQYSARIMVSDNSIAWLETGEMPTKDTKQQLYEDSTIVLDSLLEMKRFKAIAINGPAVLAVTYYHRQIK